jgi:alkylation response protein AidB-like acyl-CoA dehydrogenase
MAMDFTLTEFESELLDLGRTYAEREMRTRAERVSDGWVLTGQKAFISNAGTDMSFGVTVLARTGEDSAGKPRFGSFIVEHGALGYALEPKLRGIGWKGLDSRDLFFDGVRVPHSQVLGEPGGGLAQFLGALEVGRMSVCRAAHPRGCGPGVRGGRHLPVARPLRG